MDLPSNLGNLLMIVGVGLACWMLLRTSRARMNAARDWEAEPEKVAKEFEKRAGRQPFDGAPADVLQWQVELHQTARDLKAEIDTKLSALRAVALIAREESERLERLLAEARELKKEI